MDLYNCQERIEQVLVGNYAEIDKIVRQSDNRAKQARGNFERCTGVKCFVSEWDENVNWFMCDECEMWKHGLCELLTQSRQERISQDLEQFRCLTCQGYHSDDLLTLVEDQKQELRVERENVGSAVLETKAALAILETEAESMGIIESELNAILTSIIVERQAFHGDIFVGNHCKIILAQHEYVCSVIEGDSMYPKFVQLFGVFGEIQPFLFTKKFLSEAEISRVQAKCWEFGTLFPKYFPNESITRKIHELIFDVPVFLSAHKTIGRYAEEEGESLHNSVNQELRRLACVRNDVQKLKLVLKGQETRGKADRSLAVPTPRLCPLCKGQGKRSFLKKGSCPTCPQENPVQ